MFTFILGTIGFIHPHIIPLPWCGFHGCVFTTHPALPRPWCGFHGCVK